VGEADPGSDHASAARGSLGGAARMIAG
jgi:hypothetical protein